MKLNISDFSGDKDSAMNTIGYNIDLKINGEAFPVDTVNDLRKYGAFFLRVADHLEKAPSLDELKGLILSPQPSQEKEKRIRSKNNSTPAIGKRAIDYAIRALKVIEDSGDMPINGTDKFQVYHVAVKLGWTTRSTEEKNAVRVLDLMMHQNPDLISMYQGKIKLTDKGRLHLHELEKNLTLLNDEAV